MTIVQRLHNSYLPERCLILKAWTWITAWFKSLLAINLHYIYIYIYIRHSHYRMKLNWVKLMTPSFTFSIFRWACVDTYFRRNQNRNDLGKNINTPKFQMCVKLYHYSRRMALALNNPRRLIWFKQRDQIISKNT